MIENMRPISVPVPAIVRTTRAGPDSWKPFISQVAYG